MYLKMEYPQKNFKFQLGNYQEMEQLDLFYPIQTPKILNQNSINKDNMMIIIIKAKGMTNLFILST